MFRWWKEQHSIYDNSIQQLSTEMLRLICRKWGSVGSFSKYRYFSSEALAVMSFGDGSQGALGLPSNLLGVGADAYEPTLVPGLPEDVVSVSAGHYHSLALTAKGEVWTWGRNDEGQLGRGLLEPRHSWNEPKAVDGLKNVKVQAAFASGVISAAVGDDGSVWTWGRSKRGQLGHGKGVLEAFVPSRVEALSKEVVVKVSLGWGHALALSANRKVFGWGFSAEGRLGRLGETMNSVQLNSSSKLHNVHTMNSSDTHDVAEKLVLESMEKEREMPIIWEPQVLTELNPLGVIDVSCGLDHSIILCRDGIMLSGGSNTYGQLGRVNPDAGLLPVDLASFRPQTVACGLGHSLAICDMPTSKDNTNPKKIIISWGWNGSSQLGRSGPESQPSLVEGLFEGITRAVSCSRVHSLAVTEKGELWTWGCGKNGRLGLGSSFDEPEPTLVDIGCHRVVQAISGFDHNLLLVAQS